MSYDTVALVAQEPGLETVARTLERTVRACGYKPTQGPVCSNCTAMTEGAPNFISFKHTHPE